MNAVSYPLADQRLSKQHIYTMTAFPFGQLFVVIPFMVGIGFLVVILVLIVQAVLGIGRWAEDNSSPIVAVQAAGINRGELRLLSMRPDGWRPGQDISGVVVRVAADGTGPVASVRPPRRGRRPARRPRPAPRRTGDANAG